VKLNFKVVILKNVNYICKPFGENRKWSFALSIAVNMKSFGKVVGVILNNILNIVRNINLVFFTPTP
jgi:hypothetical protein